MSLADATGRLRAGRVVLETLSLVASAALPLAPIWLAIAAVNFATSLVEPHGAADGFARDVLWFGESLAIGVFSMATVRTLLRAPDVWRLDRGGLTLAAVDVASSVALRIWNGVMPDADGSLHWPLLTAWIAGGLAVWWVFIRIALWTYAKGLREPGVSLSQSWRRMRGTAVAIVGASLLLAVIPNEVLRAVLEDVSSKQAAAAAKLAFQVIDALKSAAFSVFIVAVPAAVWRLRGGAEDDPLAKIFD